MSPETIDPEIFRQLDNAFLSELLGDLRIFELADFRLACYRTDRIHAFFHVVALVEVRDADFGNNVGEIIGVDHDRFEIKVCILLQSDGIELIDEAREAFFRDGRDHLDDELLAAVAVAHEFVAVRHFFARFFHAGVT